MTNIRRIVQNGLTVAEDVLPLRFEALQQTRPDVFLAEDSQARVLPLTPNRQRQQRVDVSITIPRIDRLTIGAPWLFFTFTTFLAAM